jgi:hypothetical protein
LSVAAALAVFVLYTSIAGAGTPQIQPKDLAQHTGVVLLVGKVVSTRGDSHSPGGMHFVLRDVKGDSGTRARVVYQLGDVRERLDAKDRLVPFGV